MGSFFKPHHPSPQKTYIGLEQRAIKLWKASKELWRTAQNSGRKRIDGHWEFSPLQEIFQFLFTANHYYVRLPCTERPPTSEDCFLVFVGVVFRYGFSIITQLENEMKMFESRAMDILPYVFLCTSMASFFIAHILLCQFLFHFLAIIAPMCYIF